MNGIPSPREYASNNENAWLGVVAVSVRMLPRIGPIHGVHPVANASPKTNDSGYLLFRLLAEFFSQNLVC